MKRTIRILNLLCLASFGFGLHANSKLRDVLHQSLGRIEQEQGMSGGRERSAEETAKLERRMESVHRQLDLANCGRSYTLGGLAIVVGMLAFAGRGKFERRTSDAGL